MVGVSQIHFEVVPGSVLKDAHVPWTCDGVGKLPDDVEALLVGESFVVGLEDGVSPLPQVRTQCVESVAAVLGF